MSELSKNLRKLRTSKGMTIKKCADFIGVSSSTYRDWEYGRSINGEPYQRIAELFDVGLAQLFGKEESELLSRINDLQKRLQQSLEDIKLIKSML